MSLQDSLFAIDREAELRVYVNGLELPSGLDQDGNVKGLSVDYEIDQLPPTVAIELAKIPSWVEAEHDIWINAGYDGFFRRIFTGFVKKRRHSANGETLDCAGKTSVLTRTYRVEAKSWTSQTALVAVEDILDDLTPALTDYDIDAAVADIVLGSVIPAVLEVAPPSDMIHDIVDLDGHRIYEAPSGTLVIRPLLEAPAPTGVRTYSTDPASTDEISDTVDSYSDSNIDTELNIGDVLANTSRGQSFTPTVSGTIVKVSVWLKKVGVPTDKVTFELRADDGSGLPDTLVLGGAASYPGSTLTTGSWTKVTFTLPANPAGDGTSPSLSGTVYHLVISRSGSLDAANYYRYGVDASAPSYAGGQASVYDDTTWSLVAGTDAAFEITTRVYPALRILDISDDEDLDQIKKQVKVLGAMISSTDSEGNEIATQVSAEWETDSWDLVRGAPELFAMTYQSHLIDTVAQATKTAARLGNKFHRVLESVQVRVPFDPLVALGTTITLDDPEITGKSGNWWVFAYKHVLSQGELSTEMSLFGGDQSGTSGNLAPFVDFTKIIERELIGNAIQVAITFTDNSKDYGGSIVYYQWADTYSGGAMDIEGADVYSVTRVYDPSIDTEFTVTLTVTDNLGLSRSKTITINIDELNESAQEIYLPQLSCAAGNTCMYSPDGGYGWVDKATPSGVAKVTEMYLAPDPTDIPYIVFGTDNGRVYRTIDGCATLTLVLNVGAGNAIIDIAEAPLQPGRLWMLTVTGLIYQTIDFGANWTLYADLGAGNIVQRKYSDPSAPGFIDPTPCNKILVSSPGVNRLWVMGGVGTDPATWVVSNYLPDGPSIWWSDIGPGLWLPLTSSGDVSDTVIDTVISHRISGDLGLLFQGRNNPPQTMYIYGPPRWFETTEPWVEGVGLPAGVDGRGIAGNHGDFQIFLALLDNKNAYRTIDGFTWEELVGVLPGTAGNRPNSLRNLTAWWGIYLSAQDEGIAKTVDFGANWAFLRPNAAAGTTWPGGAIGYDVSFEYLRPRSVDLMIIVRDRSGLTENALVVRKGTGGWVDKGPLPSGYSDYPHRLWHFPQIDDQTVFYIRYTAATMDHVEDLYRSTNLGGAWASVLTRCGTIARGPDGRLWASRENHVDPTGHSGNSRYPHAIYFSDDDGATWTLAYEDTRNSGGAYISYFNIAVDPNDNRRVMAAGNYPVSNIRILVTEDAHLGASATWSEVTPTGLTGYSGSAPRYHQPLLIAGENGRWIIGKQLSSANVVEIWTSDNNGASWTKRYSANIASSTFGFSDAFRMGNVLFFGGGMSGSSADRGGLISFDNGDTWDSLTVDTNAHEGFVWDGRYDKLFANLDTTGEELKSMQPPRVGSVWVGGIDGDLDTVMGYTVGIVENGLEVLGT